MGLECKYISVPEEQIQSHPAASPAMRFSARGAPGSQGIVPARHGYESGWPKPPSARPFVPTAHAPAPVPFNIAPATHRNHHVPNSVGSHPGPMAIPGHGYQYNTPETAPQAGTRAWLVHSRCPLLLWMEPLILSVPTEILLEFAAYYHNTSLPYDTYPDPTTPGSGDPTVPTGLILTGRSQLLRALSQACRRFRHIFLSLSWEHLEGLPVDNDRTGRHFALLLRRMTGLLKTPSLRRYPRPIILRSLVVSLKAPGHSQNRNLLAVLARFLRATPHLTSLHVIDISEAHCRILSGLFEDQSFPAVQTLAIPACLSRTLSAFPSIHSLTCADLPSANESIALLKHARKHCPSLERLVNITPSLPVIKSLVEHFPLVKDLRFRSVVTSDIAEELGSLQNLRTVQFRHLTRGEKSQDAHHKAEAIFRSSAISTGQPIQVRYLSPEPEVDVGELLVEASIGPTT
ncbi:hypothetical protein GGX14DRAFT_699595 [Mycena pura]|uniref:Uncharacterized protein n=1 Tax=Mycena pura TaxID=153505 RepID=A0AAD6Y5U2_9AGAR|nr:hypothetical protein GGX14DRAFT_699595 [Mycena pura]